MPDDVRERIGRGPRRQPHRPGARREGRCGRLAEVPGADITRGLTRLRDRAAELVRDGHSAEGLVAGLRDTAPGRDGDIAVVALRAGGTTV